jgi:hypothetical protein
MAVVKSAVAEKFPASDAFYAKFFSFCADFRKNFPACRRFEAFDRWFATPTSAIAGGYARSSLARPMLTRRYRSSKERK